jgi:Tfp pilus assembly protein PilF
MDRIEKLKQFLQSTPNDAFLQHALALEYVKMGDDTAALELFENIVNQTPNYVGTYYHLAKLHERQGQTEQAIAVYEKGMAEAKAAKDNHAYNELQAAYEDLTNF